MTLISGFEGDKKSYLVCDSIITDSSDITIRNYKMKSYFSNKYGVVVAGDLAHAQQVLCFAAMEKSLIHKLHTDVDAMFFAQKVVEVTGDEATFDSIWVLPNGGVYQIDAVGCAVRAPHNLLVGGNVAPYMKGAFQALSKYSPSGGLERRLRMASEATLECSEGAAWPVVIKSWKK